MWLSVVEQVDRKNRGEWKQKVTRNVAVGGNAVDDVKMLTRRLDSNKSSERRRKLGNAKGKNAAAIVAPANAAVTAAAGITPVRGIKR